MACFSPSVPRSGTLTHRSQRILGPWDQTQLHSLCFHSCFLDPSLTHSSVPDRLHQGSPWHTTITFHSSCPACAHYSISLYLPIIYYTPHKYITQPRPLLAKGSTLKIKSQLICVKAHISALSSDGWRMNHFWSTPHFAFTVINQWVVSTFFDLL